MRCFCDQREQNMGEGRAEPRTVYAMLYAPTTVGRRAQRGATERSEFKRYFSINFILTGFYSININLFFVLNFWQREIKGVNAKNSKLLAGAR